MPHRRRRTRQRGYRVVVGASLPRPLYEQLNAIAARQGITASTLLRRLAVAEVGADMQRQLETDAVGAR